MVLRQLRRPPRRDRRGFGGGVRADLRHPRSLRSGFAFYRAVHIDVTENEPVPKLGIPCLAVGGGTSWGQGAEVETSLSRKATRVRGVVLDGCGHWVPEEKPAELVVELLALLAER